MEERRARFVKSKCWKEFIWSSILAAKKKKKGTAKGRFLIGVIKSWMGEKNVKMTRMEKDVIRTEIHTEKEKFGI